MTRRKISLASLFVVLGGGVFLTAPAHAAPESFACRDSVRAYCQYVADNYCSKGATCTYEIASCQITNSQCIT